jgi:hypothetical protein
MLQAVGNQAQRQRLNRDSGLLLGASIRCHTRKGRDVGKPTAIFLAEVLNGQGELAVW